MKNTLFIVKDILNFILISIILFFSFANNLYFQKIYIIVFISLIYFISFIISIILQFKYYNCKNHIALKIFYIFTLMIPFFLEKIVEKIIRWKYIKLTPKIIKIFNEEKIKYHIIYGTFLFMIRNKNFGDSDIDFAIWKQDFNEKEFLEKMKKREFILKEKYFLNNELKELCFNHKKYSISIDIFIIDKEKPLGISFNEKIYKYSRRRQPHKYSLKKYKLYDLEFYGPKDSDSYLTWLYGEWKKPDINYHWFYGPSNPKNIIIKNKSIKKISF